MSVNGTARVVAAPGRIARPEVIALGPRRWWHRWSTWTTYSIRGEVRTEREHTRYPFRWLARAVAARVTIPQDPSVRVVYEIRRAR